MKSSFNITALSEVEGKYNSILKHNSNTQVLAKIADFIRFNFILRKPRAKYELTENEDQPITGKAHTWHDGKTVKFSEATKYYSIIITVFMEINRNINDNRNNQNTFIWTI